MGTPSRCSPPVALAGGGRRWQVAGYGGSRQGGRRRDVTAARRLTEGLQEHSAKLVTDGAV